MLVNICNNLKQNKRNLTLTINLTLNVLLPSIHPASVPWWRLLDFPGKMINFQKFSRVRPGNSIPTGEASKKRIRDTAKIRRDKLTNTRLTQKQRNWWIISVKNLCEYFISYRRIVKGWKWNPIYKLSDEYFN